MQFIVQARIHFMNRQQESDVRQLGIQLENILTNYGTMVGLQSGYVQAFCASSNINLEEECRRFSTSRQDFWFGKFLQNNIYLYIFILGDNLA